MYELIEITSHGDEGRRFIERVPGRTRVLLVTYSDLSVELWMDWEWVEL